MTQGPGAATCGEVSPLIDPFGREVTYLRLSVTDRCDLRCTYCMAEDMSFLPRAEILSLEELERVAAEFIGLGVTRLRITGGEPLVRRGVPDLLARLGRHLGHGLEELTLTTNGTHLAQHAAALAQAGVRRVNVSLDTLDAARFARITRWGRLDRVLAGLEAARTAGLAVRINTVALRSENEDEIESILEWCGRRGFDLCLIETMPLGDVAADRMEHYLPLSLVRARLSRRFTLEPSAHETPGPARYVRVRETGGRLGFITPLSHNFCEGCNRVRVTVSGTMYMCLGQDDAADLRPALRSGQDGALREAIRAGIARKPQGHDFVIGRKRPAVARHMSATGG